MTTNVTKRKGNTAVPQKGEFIKITERRCGRLQPSVKAGGIYQVRAAQERGGVVYAECCDRTAASGTVRLNSARFGWEVMTAREIAAEKFGEECRQEARALCGNFSKAEQTQIAIVPLIFYRIIWHYADLAVGEAISNRVEILKKATRQVRETRRAYERYLSQDLDMLHTEMIDRQTDGFMAECSRDFTLLYYSVNGEFKRAYPDYPYDRMRTYAIMAELLVRFAEEHASRMDTLIASRLGASKRTLLMPPIIALKTLMECIAGVDSRFDYGASPIATGMAVLANRIRAIEFNIL